MNNPADFSCPLPHDHGETITLAHGGGGRMTEKLLDEIFRPAFANAELEARHDGALLHTTGEGKLAFSTDSHVVQPLFFPGGDLGKLAVCGTINDLAMCAARPRWLSAGFILEEGLPLETLRQIVASMAEAARLAGVTIVTGDTKVVERGKADGLYLTTAGIGEIVSGSHVSPARLEPGQAVILSGDVGRHGMAVMARREGLEFEADIESDCANLWPAVQALLEEQIPLQGLRDCTRGGLATTLIELAETSATRIEILDTAVPVHEPVRGACEILGFDPLFVANEGCFVAIVPEDKADEAVRLLREGAGFPEAVCIGSVQQAPDGKGICALQNAFGVSRVLDRLSGEQLPRIC